MWLRGDVDAAAQFQSLHCSLLSFTVLLRLIAKNSQVNEKACIYISLPWSILTHFPFWLGNSSKYNTK